jgi:C4-dicarboxylate transporter, DctM subunit
MNPATLHTVLNAVLLVLALGQLVLAFRANKRFAGIFAGIAIGLYLLTSKTAFLVLGTILVCLLTAQPLFVLMGLLGISLLATLAEMSSVDELTVVPRKLLELASKEVLLAIPFFVVAGELMTQGSLARRLVEAMRSLVSWLPGGMAVAAVGGCVFFAAISGSSPVTVVAIGSIMVPALVKAKYPESFSIGLLTSAGSLGILIPPSIPMIVYSIMVSASTPVDPRDLFMAGVVPGLFIGAMLAGYAIFVGASQKIPTEPFSWPLAKQAIKDGFWSLMLPVVILGGIYTGVFTATEAACVSVVYALAVEVLIHKELDTKKLVDVATNSMTVMGSLLVIIALAINLNYLLVLQEVPDLLVNWLKELELTKWSFLLAVNILLLIVGCFMDIMSAILILAPMLAPMAGAMGIHPIHMGIIFIVNLEIGYLTPPVGLNLFVSSTLFKKSIGFVIRAVLPTLVIMLVALAVITRFDSLALAFEDKPEEKPAEQPALTDEQNAPVDAGPALDAGPKRAKTIQELMQEAQAGASDAGTASAAPPTDTAPKKAKTIAELMAEAQAKDAATDAGSSSASDAGL